MFIQALYIAVAIGSTLPLYAYDHFAPHSNSPASFSRAGSGIAIADDASCFYLNPAGLSRQENQRDIYFSHRMVDSPKRWGLTAGLIDGKSEDPLHFGLLFNTVHTRTVEFDDYIVASSFNLFRKLMVGATQKLTNFDAASLTRESWAYSLNLGALYFLNDYLAVGLVFENLIRTISDARMTPISVGSGFSVNFEKFRIALDLKRNQSQDLWLFKGGADLQAFTSVTMHAGFYSDHHGDQKGYSAGLSFLPHSQLRFELGFQDELNSKIKAFSSGLSFRL